MNIEKIIIYTSEPFPFGLAATNRILSYAKGFVFNGLDVEVVCFRKSGRSIQKKLELDKGTYQGVRFLYLSNGPIRSQNVFVRKIQDLYSIVLLFFYSLKNTNKQTASIFYSSYFLPALILRITTKLKKSLFLKDESEHPEIRSKNGFDQYIFENYHYNLFDGLLLITKSLINYFKAKNSVPSILVSMTVDINRFNCSGNSNQKENNIVYTGWLNDEKDGVDILIKAFADFVKEYNSYKLHLFGPVKSESQMLYYKELVNSLNISSFVNFGGVLGREDITKVLCEAKILVLPRPDSVQARNGFPTKLGEYLATGNPTVVTSVGEIPNYLTDGVDSFLAIPGDVMSLKNKLFEVVMDYSKSKEIGVQGRKLAERKFNSEIESRKVIDFLKRLGK